jgi:nucleotide-binding universal stress UspA family protein
MVIVAAVDRFERAANVIREANELAESFDEPLHVVHVLTRSEFLGLERTSVDETGTTLDMSHVRDVAEEVAAEAAADLDVAHEPVGLTGDPADRIVEYADDQDARYVVVSGRKRSPAGKMIFGSVAQSILLNAGCPVVSTIDQSGE